MTKVNENDPIMHMNLSSTMANQDNKCLECESELNPNRVYFRMDQAIHLYEVYCKVCGLEKEKQDKG